MVTDASSILSETSVEVVVGTFTLVAFDHQTWFKLLEDPKTSPRMSAPFMIFRDQFEVTMLVDEEDLSALQPRLGNAKIESGFRLLTFLSELPFGVYGFLAALTRILAEAEIPVVAVSSFSRDHLLIKQDDLASTLRALGPHVKDLC